MQVWRKNLVHTHSRTVDWDIQATLNIGQSCGSNVAQSKNGALKFKDQAYASHPIHSQTFCSGWQGNLEGCPSLILSRHGMEEPGLAS
jgi:hypothetical protein